MRLVFTPALAARSQLARGGPMAMPSRSAAAPLRALFRGSHRAASALAQPGQRADAARAPRAEPPRLGFDFESAAMAPPAITPLLIQRASPADMRAYSAQVWKQLRAEAAALASGDALLSGYLKAAVVAHETLALSLAHVLADRLSGNGLDREHLAPLLAEHLADERVMRASLADLLQVVSLDPCTPDLLTVLLHFKGFHGLQSHRVAHALWRRGGAAARHTALLLQGRGSAAFGMDIHPQAQIGLGVFFDHASGVVVGQTASIGDFCYVLHGVTLGSTGKTINGRRHPSIRSHVSLGAGSAILGPVTIHDHALVGAHAIVSKHVQKGATVIGTNKVLAKNEADAEEFDWLTHWHI